MLWRILKSCNFICKRYGLALFFFQIQSESGLERFFWFSLLLGVYVSNDYKATPFSFSNFWNGGKFFALSGLELRFFFSGRKWTHSIAKKIFPDVLSNVAQPKPKRQDKLTFLKCHCAFTLCSIRNTKIQVLQNFDTKGLK